MKMKAYFRERATFLCINGILCLITAIFLYFVNVQAVAIMLLVIGWFVPLLIAYFIDFYQKKTFYDCLTTNLETLDQKYLLSEIIDEPDFLEGKMVYDILKTTDKQMHEHVNLYKNKQQEYREYIEAWVHEVKTPIASSKLILDNQRNESTKGIYEELDQIEAFVEQALYYARSNSASKDYIVKEFLLNESIMNVIKKNAKSFIHKKIKLHLDEVTDIVFSDEKWVEFILNQVIVNSINYCYGENKEIHIWTSKHQHNCILHIRDNGIGIDEKDIGRVFEKGFTGENGRVHRKSTGMGLYLCKKLADKLHLGISIESIKDVGTEVDIIFPKSKVVLLES